jgi:hypothetical protein
MPAIAPIEDLRAAQEEGLNNYAMLYAPCAMRGSVRLRPHDLRLTASKGCGFRKGHRSS